MLLICMESAFATSGSTTESPAVSVGKLRSSADAAFSSGELEQALKLWAKVCELAYSAIPL